MKILNSEIKRTIQIALLERIENIELERSEETEVVAEAMTYERGCALDALQWINDQEVE